VGARVACIDSSGTRLERLSGTLERAGWEVWPGRDVRDLLLLATRLRFEAIVADEASTLAFPELWEQAQQGLFDTPLLLHSVSGQKQRSSLGVGHGVGVKTDQSEFILLMLMLLLEGDLRLQQAAA
jgi:hypothetical protein